MGKSCCGFCLQCVRASVRFGENICVIMQPTLSFFSKCTLTKLFAASCIIVLCLNCTDLILCPTPMVPAFKSDEWFVITLEVQAWKFARGRS